MRDRVSLGLAKGVGLRFAACFRHRFREIRKQDREPKPQRNLDAPADAVTGSASGLDPHISPADADLQAARVAKARGASRDQVRSLIAEATNRPALGFIGEWRVHVLLLNVSLVQKFPPHK